MIDDFVLVGTNPIHVLKACAQRLAGHLALMIDRAPAPGAAWTTLRMLSHDDIESDPHFLLYLERSNSPRDDLGMDLQNRRSLKGRFPITCGRPAYATARLGCGSLC